MGSYAIYVKTALDIIGTRVFTESLHPATSLYINLLVALFHMFLFVILFKKPGKHQEFKSLYTPIFHFSGPVLCNIPTISLVLRQFLSSQSKIGKE